MRAFLATLLVLAMTAAVADAEGTCNSYEADEEVDTGETPGGRYYVDANPCDPGTCLYDVWIYQESNGEDGLQRGDDVCWDGGCCGETDTIIF